MSYAQARLTVGISGVGTVVVLATVGLLFDWSGRLDSIASDVAAVGMVLLLHAAILTPFDLFGGWILPRRFGRSDASFPSFLGRWIRGLLVQSLVIGGIALALLYAGRFGGLPAALATFGISMAVLVAAQERIARGLASIPLVKRSDDVSVLRSNDVGFTGGIVGLPGRERFLIPHRWNELLTPEGVSVQKKRWASTVSSGRRIVGLAVALLWNLIGFTAAASLPNSDVTSVSGLTSIALAFTLWTFIGLLLLPSLSRPAVFAADRAASSQQGRDDVLLSTLAHLDRAQDDEPNRTPGIETIFHPIPALARRAKAIKDHDEPALGAWHAARMALYLSWAGFGFLSRAVHCNSGRPELWVLLPCD